MKKFIIFLIFINFSFASYFCDEMRSTIDINKKRGFRFDEITYFLGAGCRDDYLMYFYELEYKPKFHNIYFTDHGKELWKKTATDLLGQQFCYGDLYEAFRQLNISLHFIYYFRYEIFMKIIMNNQICKYF